MITIYKKELSTFFSTITAPLIIGLFLIITSLILWSDISQLNIFKNVYASMDNYFTISPILFLIFIPAICMKSFSEEFKSGTMEILLTKPIRTWELITGKLLAVSTIIIFSIIPSLVYVASIYYLGENKGNLDLASIIGSYIGLLLISNLFISMCIYVSSLTKNQIVSLISGIVLCTTFYFGFDLLSDLKLFQDFNIFIKKIGISYHYESISKGLLLISDIVYFLSATFFFMKLTEIKISS